MILGIIPFWVGAVLVSLVGSILNVTGFLLQKMALKDEGWPKIGDITLSPKWLLGFLLAVIAPFPGDIIAYSLAPLSLTAPLSGFSAILNTIVAPFCLGERLQPWPDYAAMLLIVVGCISSTATGSKEDNYSNFTFEEMLQLGEDPAFLVALVILLVSLAVCIIYMVANAATMKKIAEQRPDNPPMNHVVLPAFAAAGAGGLTNIWLKALSLMLRTSQPLLNDAACLLLGVVPFAILQINFLNRGLGLYFQTIMFPCYSALLVLANTVLGAIFYQEYKDIVKSPERSVFFVLGVVCVVSGISLFRYRKALHREQDNYPTADGDSPPSHGGSVEAVPRRSEDALQRELLQAA